jgi:hypothetical protein
MQRERANALITAVLLLVLLAIYFYGSYTRYWILRDGVQTTALITSVGYKGSIHYAYRVAGHRYTDFEYKGASEGRALAPAKQCTVWYSASRPWLSSLPPREPVFRTWPAPAIVLILEFAFLAEAFAPKGWWRVSSLIGRRRWQDSKSARPPS